LVGWWRAGYKDAAPDGSWRRHQRHPALLRKRRAVLETILNRFNWLKQYVDFDWSPDELTVRVSSCLKRALG